METQTVIAPTQPLNAEQIKTWSILSQFAFFLNFILPVAGLVALIVTYLNFGKRDVNLKTNVAAALNAEITSWLVAIVGIVAMAVPYVAIYFAASGNMNAAEMRDSATTLGFWIIGGSLVLFSYGIYRLVSSIMNGFAIADGKTASYTLVIPFVR